MYIWDIIRKICFFFFIVVRGKSFKNGKACYISLITATLPRAVTSLCIFHWALIKNINFFADETDGAGPGLTVNINQSEHLPLSANWFGQAEPSSVRKYITCVLAGQLLQHISSIIAPVRVVPHYKSFLKVAENMSSDEVLISLNVWTEVVIQLEGCKKTIFARDENHTHASNILVKVYQMKAWFWSTCTIAGFPSNLLTCASVMWITITLLETPEKSHQPTIMKIEIQFAWDGWIDHWWGIMQLRLI